MQQRVERIRTDIRVMQQRRVLSWNEARNLDMQAQNLQRRIFRASRNGIRPGEARSLENQIFNSSAVSRARRTTGTAATAITAATNRRPA